MADKHGRGIGSKLTNRLPIIRFTGVYAFLSNFYEFPIEYEGQTYPTVEHAYQAAKTLDPIRRSTIQRARTAGIAKRLGRGVDLRPDWDKVRVHVMRDLLAKKFSDPLMLAWLKQTAPRMLIEGNRWHDNFWGSCECSDCGNKGQNRLGITLMAIRSLDQFHGGKP